MNPKSYIYTIAISLVSSINVLAQVDTTVVLTESQQEAKSQLGNEELEVIKAFKANLAKTNSLSLTPSIESSPAVNRDYDYRVSIVPYDIDYAEPTIKPFAMKPDPAKEYYKFYAKLGYGNRQSPLADISYHNTSSKVEYGILANYLALNNESENLYQKMSDLDVDVHANIKLTDNLELLTKLYTSIDERYFYHIDANKLFFYNELSSKRNLNTYGAKVGIQNSSYYALQYKLDVDANLLNITNDDTNELNTAVKGMISYAGKSVGVSLESDLHYSKGSNSIDSSFISVSAHPSIFWSNKRFNIRAGASGIIANDSTYLFPTAELLIDILPDRFQFIAGLDQEYIHNNIQNVVSFNPYYHVQNAEYGSTITKSYYGGAQGEWAKLIYRGTIGYREITNQVILTNAAEDVRKFDLNFIDMNTVFVEATANYLLNETFTIGGGFQQNIFDLDKGVVAYHLPSMRYNAFTIINLLDSKLTIRPTLAFTDKVEYIDFNGNTAKLDNMLSLNANFNYRIGDYFGLFVDAKNLLANNYTEYYGYDDVGFHIHGGITLRF